MATIGQVLTAPEAGWRRYDDSDGRIQYVGTWSKDASSGEYNTTGRYIPEGTSMATINASYIQFQFYGTKIRFIQSIYPQHSTNIKYSIDGIEVGSGNAYGASTVRQVVIFEKLDLQLGCHTVKIYSGNGVRFDFDAVDIDANGDLLGTGIQLTAPENGWRRYDDSDSRIKLIGTAWNTTTNASFYNGSYKVTSNTSDYISFQFIGIKLRLISSMSYYRSRNICISIDGVVERFDAGNSSSSPTYQMLVYEKTNLESKVHDVKVYLDSNSLPMLKDNITHAYELDAIDIDSTGCLVHPTLTQRTRVEDMQVGDCIPCRYTTTASGIVGYFGELGTCIANEIPVTGTATPDGLFYLIKTAKGTLVADRVLQTNISWDTLNANKYIEGLNRKYIEGSELIANGVTTISVDSVYQGNPANCSTSGWASENSGSHYIIFDLKSEKYLCYFEVKNNDNGRAFGDGTYAITSMDLYTSLDNVTYTKITTFSANTTAMFRYNFNNGVKARYLKIVPTAMNNDNIARLSKYKLFANGTDDSKNVLIRSLLGGCAYADINGNMSLTDQGKGAYPVTNEWDKYIVGSNLNGKITAGDNNIWNVNQKYNWCKETPVNGTNRVTGSSPANNTCRVLRGFGDSYQPIGKVRMDNISSSYTDVNGGFRPVVEHIEPNGSRKQTTLWY